MSRKQRHLPIFTLTCLATSTPPALIVHVCQPRPDTTHVGTSFPLTRKMFEAGWCWCQRTGCKSDSLFMTLPTYMRQHGFVTAGNGKLFHPVSASAPPYGGRLRSPTLSIRICNVCLFLVYSFPPHLVQQDACHADGFTHAEGDDPRAWSYGTYHVEANVTQEQWGTCVRGTLDSKKKNQSIL